MVNVATGHAETIRSLIERLCALAGITAAIEVDPALVRVDDPPEIRGDASLLTELTGWRPEVPLQRTLTDLLAEAETGVAAGHERGTGDRYHDGRPSHDPRSGSDPPHSG